MRRAASFLDGSLLLIPARVASVQNRTSFTNQAVGSNTNSAHRFQHQLGADHSALWCNVNNWITGTTALVAGANPYTILEMSLENAGGTISVPVTFGGSRSKLVNPNDTDINSDKVFPSAFGLSKFSRSEKYWVKVKLLLQGTLTNPITASSVNDVTGQQGNWYTAANTTVSSVDTPGAFTYTGTAWSVYGSMFVPMLLGNPINDGVSTLAVGDSIAEQVNDASNGVIGKAFFQRAHAQADYTLPLPCINLARTGASSQAYASYTQWVPYCKYAKYGFEEMVTNDVGGANLPNLQANVTAIWATMKTNGIKKIIRTKFIARTTSTDNWATTANQTIPTGYGPGEYTDQFNAWLPSQVAAGKIDYILSNDEVRFPGDSHLWNVNGSPNFVNYDLQHPNANGHALLAAPLRALLATLN